MNETPQAAPRLLVTDTLGRRLIPIDKPLVTLGRRSETDVRVPGAGVSRVHAEIVSENGVYRLRDCASRFGTFVNGERATEHVLAHGDRIKLGQSDDTEIVFYVGDEATSSQERSATWPSVAPSLVLYETSASSSSFSLKRTA